MLGALEGGFVLVFEFLTTKEESFLSICRYFLASLKISTEVYFLAIVFLLESGAIEVSKLKAIFIYLLLTFFFGLYSE